MRGRVSLLLLLPVAAFAYPLPPSVPATNVLAADGYLDATLYAGVDPTGKTDSTAGLQKALDDAYAYGLTAYLPSGTYLVSDTLHEDQIYKESGCAEAVPGYGGAGSIVRAPGLVGAVRPTRPKIVLADGAAGFGDPTNPKAVVAFRNYDTADPGVGTSWEGESDCGFRMVMRGFDLALGAGNAGAVGLQNPSAQYSTVEDITVDATGAYAGMRGAVTTNSMVNLSVTGGQYGIIADICCGISLAGVTLHGQTTASLWSDTFGTTTMSGFDLAPAAGAAAVLVQSSSAQGGQVALFDGSITMTGAAAPVIANGGQRGLYLGAVWVQTTGALVVNGTGAPVPIPAGWQLVAEYAFNDPNTCQGSGTTPSQSTMLVDGVESTGPRLTLGAAGAPPADLLRRHAWTSIPWLDDAGVKNVKDADIGAKGDGTTDDSAAIQAALDGYTAVFLPRGDYLLGKPLTMHAGSRLFGVTGQLTRLFPQWTANGQFGHAITTDAAVDGDAYLGDVHVMLPIGAAESYIGAVDWRVGRNSIVRQIGVEEIYEDPAGDTGTMGRKVVQIAGGGRWYGLAIDGSWRSGNPDYRGVLVTGTTEPTSFYGMNLEHNHGAAQIEIASSSNVRILGTKTETNAFALFNQSSNVAIAGLTANSHGPTRFVDSTDSTDVLGPNLQVYCGDQGSATWGPMVYESTGGQTYATPDDDVCGLFRRGNFDETPFNTVTSSGGTPDAGATQPGVPTLGACAASNAITIDGQTDDWTHVPVNALPSSRVVSGACSGDADCSARFRVQWDAQNLYVLVEVTDDVVTGTNALLFENDSVELYLDGADSRAATYDATDFQLTVDWRDEQGGIHGGPITFASAAVRTATGYTVEYAVPWSALGGTAAAARTLGFDLAVNDNDADDGVRDAQLFWYGDGTGWSDPATFGAVTLSATSCADASPDGSNLQPDGGTGASAAAGGGCGCDVGGRSTAPAGALVVVLLLVLAARRRDTPAA